MTGAAGWQDRLLQAIAEYDRSFPVYDEVFAEVHQRITASGDAGKTDIAVIGFWKRSAQGRWVGELLNVPERDVRAATRAGFAADSDGEALKALAVLPGFASQEAIPTTLLTAFDPVGYGVMDRRARKALDDLGFGVGTSRGMTIRYLEQVRDLRDQLRPTAPAITARDVDKGLYVLGG